MFNLLNDDFLLDIDVREKYTDEHTTEEIFLHSLSLL